jgi:hypothetical protein
LTRFVPLLLGFLTVIPLATADTPGFLDPVMGQVCGTLQAAEKCTKCTCEAITQSNPTQTWDKATVIPTCTLVLVAGLSESSQRVNALHAVCGSPKALYHGGRVAQTTAPADIQRKASIEVTDSKQHYDMCPGGCGHLAVGAVHLFEIVVSIDERTGQFAGVATDPDGPTERLESRAKELVTCYMADDKEPLTCFATTLAYANRLVYPHKKRQARMKGWTRTWKLGGGRFGMALKVGKLTGKNARSAKDDGVGKAPLVSHFIDMEKRSDTVKVTEDTEGRLLTIDRTPPRP